MEEGGNSVGPRMFLCCRGRALDRESGMPPPGAPDPSAPFPVRSVGPEYCANPSVHQVASVPPADLQAFPTQTGLHGPVGVSLASAAPDVESLKPVLLASQPLLYVPSTSLFMLYGSLQEGPSPGPGAERDGRGSEVPAGTERSPTPAAQKRLSEDRRPQEADGPAAKQQRRDDGDSPLSLVMPKVRGFGWTCSVTSH